MAAPKRGNIPPGDSKTANLGQRNIAPDLGPAATSNPAPSYDTAPPQVRTGEVEWTMFTVQNAENPEPMNKQDRDIWGFVTTDAEQRAAQRIRAPISARQEEQQRIYALTDAQRREHNLGNFQRPENQASQRPLGQSYYHVPFAFGRQDRDDEEAMHLLPPAYQPDYGRRGLPQPGLPAARQMHTLFHDPISREERAQHAFRQAMAEAPPRIMPGQPSQATRQGPFQPVPARAGFNSNTTTFHHSTQTSGYNQQADFYNFYDPQTNYMGCLGNSGTKGKAKGAEEAPTPNARPSSRPTTAPCLNPTAPTFNPNPPRNPHLHPPAINPPAIARGISFNTATHHPPPFDPRAPGNEPWSIGDNPIFPTEMTRNLPYDPIFYNPNHPREVNIREARRLEDEAAVEALEHLQIGDPSEEQQGRAQRRGPQFGQSGRSSYQPPGPFFRHGENGRPVSGVQGGYGRYATQGAYGGVPTQSTDGGGVAVQVDLMGRPRSPLPDGHWECPKCLLMLGNEWKLCQRCGHVSPQMWTCSKCKLTCVAEMTKCGRCGQDRGLIRG